MSDLRGVMIVFNGRVILGTRARKTRTVSLQAFSSINYPELAVLQNGFLMEYIRPSALPAPVFYDKLGERVALMKMIPGADCSSITTPSSSRALASAACRPIRAAASSASCVRPWRPKRPLS